MEKLGRRDISIKICQGVLLILKKLWIGIINLFYPEGVSCPVCGEEVVGMEIDLCKKCIGEIDFIGDSFCQKCGKAVDGEREICTDCSNKEHYFCQGRSVGIYQKGLKEHIYLFKYNRDRRLARPLGDLMGIYVERFFSLGDLDLITYVPSHQERLKERGFNQARLLAREVGGRSALEVKGSLMRKSETIKQSKLGVKARAENIRGKFVLKEGVSIRGKSILLVDDIYTTGATVDEASRILLEGGAISIKVITLAIGRDINILKKDNS